MCVTTAVGKAILKYLRECQLQTAFALFLKMAFICNVYVFKTFNTYFATYIKWIHYNQLSK